MKKNSIGHKVFLLVVAHKIFGIRDHNCSFTMRFRRPTGSLFILFIDSLQLAKS